MNYERMMFLSSIVQVKPTENYKNEITRIWEMKPVYVLF